MIPALDRVFVMTAELPAAQARRARRTLVQRYVLAAVEADGAPSTAALSALESELELARQFRPSKALAHKPDKLPWPSPGARAGTRPTGVM